MNLLIPTISFSQDIPQDTIQHRLNNAVLITPQQLKTANLIFNEHQKLKEENALLYEQIQNYKDLSSLNEQIDSLYLEQINNLTIDYSEQIESLNQMIAKEKKITKYWKIGGISVSVCLLVWLIIK